MISLFVKYKPKHNEHTFTEKLFLNTDPLIAHYCFQVGISQIHNTSVSHAEFSEIKQWTPKFKLTSFVQFCLTVLFLFLYYVIITIKL